METTFVKALEKLLASSVQSATVLTFAGSPKSVTLPDMDEGLIVTE